MNRTVVLTVLKNLSWLALIAFPLFFLVVWLQALVGGGEETRNLGYVLEAGAFYYLSYVLYVLLGGVVHQILTFFLPRPWSQRRRRVAALLLTPIIPIVLVALGERLQIIAEFWVPVLVMLGVYGLVIKLPAVAD